MKPINREKQKRTYTLVGIGLFLLILYLFLHMGAVVSSGTDLSPEFIPLFLDHCTSHPFDIFPVNTQYLFAGLIAGIIAPLLVHAEYLRRRDQRPSIENGSSKWNENLRKFYKQYTEMTAILPASFERIFFLRKLRELTAKPSQGTGSLNMVFTREIFMSMNTRMTRRNNNVMVIGGSGTGKSRFFVKPNALQSNCSFIFTDPSGELLETLGGFLEREGYEVRVFNLVQMEHSNCYNPFHYIRNQEGVLIMINALIKNTTPKGSSSNDPFWEKAETALLQAICFYLVSECNEEDQNFSSVMKLLRCAKAVEGQEDVDSTLDIMFKDLAAREAEHIAVQSYAVFKSAGGGKTAQSILISCQTRLQTFNLDAIKNLTNTDDIDLGSVGDKKVALFCITPSADTTFNYLVALLYTQLFETLYFHAETECPGKRLKHHVRFLLDEFANIGTIPDFAQKLATMRKYEISCSIIIQALSQLKAMYKDDWEVLVGNCDSLLFLGGSDATTLEYISKKLGKETISAVNRSRSYGKQGSFSMSYNKTGRELMTPDELSNMDNNNCVLFIRGLHPFFGTKYPLEKHPNFKFSGDGNREYEFDVKKRLHTAQKGEPVKIKETPARRIYTDAQRADTREADRQHRQYSRDVETRSARNRELLKTKPLNQELPAAAKAPEERTPAEQAQLDQTLVNLELLEINQMSEEQMMQYQAGIANMYFSNPSFEQYGTTSLSTEEDRKPM